jgi:Sap-like sulfolipid-1-addressing protein
MNANLAIVLFAPMAAALNPALLAAVFVMILLPNSQRLMLGYLAGAYAIGIAVSLVIVLSLHGSGFATTSGHILGPGEYIAAGVTALTIAFVLAARLEGPLQKWQARRKTAKAKKKQAKPPWSQRMLGKGSAAVTFVVGAAMGLPGPAFLSALHHMAGLNLRIVPILLLVIYLCFMQQLLLELTLLAGVFAPGRTRAVVVRIRTWLACHGRQIAAIGLAGVGILLSVSGLIAIS